MFEFIAFTLAFLSLCFVVLFLGLLYEEAYDQEKAGRYILGLIIAVFVLLICGANTDFIL